MDEFEFFMDEDEYAIEEEYEFEQFIDHDSGYEQDEQSYYAEAMLAYYDQAAYHLCNVMEITPKRCLEWSDCGYNYNR